MSEQNVETLPSAVDNTPTVTFIKKKHELDKLLKSVEKVSQKAIEVLTETMNNDKTEAKLRVACAEALLEAHRSIVKQINDDEMTRLVAEVKLSGAKLGKSGKAIVQEEEKPKLPSLNFDEIREI